MPIEMHPLPDKSIDAVILANGHRILIRPMMREDIDLQVQFFNSLSKDARYNRFLNPMPTLSADLIDLLYRNDAWPIKPGRRFRADHPGVAVVCVLSKNHD